MTKEAESHVDHPYDVFISYSHLDQEWVKGALLPQLEAAGLKVIIDERDFAIGVPSLVNMQRAVEQSRHTLVVLTPNWVQSEWTEFESLLTTQGDPAAHRRKLMPLLLAACEAPPYIANLTYADFTDPAGRETQMARLLHDLGDHGAAVQEQVAQSGVALGEVLSYAKTIPEARYLVDLAEYSLRYNCEQIKHMKEYKDVHDLLQQLEGHYQSLHNEIYEDNKLMPAERLRWRSIRTTSEQMGNAIFELYSYVENSSLSAESAEWLSNLHQAAASLEQARKANEIGLVDEAAQLVFEVIDQQISRMNDHMVAHVDALNLPDLVDRLNKVHGLVQHHADSSLSAQLQEYQQAVADLTRMLEQLKTLRKDHDFLQQLDNKLRSEEMQLSNNTERFARRWEKSLGHELRLLSSPARLSWEVDLARQIDGVDQALQEGSTGAIADAFYFCRGAISTRFRHVDIELKRLCDGLIVHGSLLESALGKVMNAV
ncbi:MAG TPA: TIR domain-containing protein [Caldilineaceae bacterium]|nr:TIR domain-containing protein [Caldilineaceae bacterium]